MAAILASQWFIPTIVTSAAVIIGQLGAIDGHLPETYHTPTAHLVRVHLGMGGDGWNGTDMGGVPPRIDLYDAWGQRLSHDYTKKTPILEGGFQDYMIEPDEEHNNRRAAYIRVGAGKLACLIRTSGSTRTNQIFQEITMAFASQVYQLNTLTKTKLSSLATSPTKHVDGVGTIQCLKSRRLIRRLRRRTAFGWTTITPTISHPSRQLST